MELNVPGTTCVLEQEMASTDPTGVARQVNRAILAATLAFGAAAAVALPFIVQDAPEPGAVSCLAYGATLLASCVCSFLYNTLEQARRRTLLRVLDHSAIFLLIAGTYTPFAVIALGKGWGPELLAAVWTLALFGIGLKLVLDASYDRSFVPFYLALGWICVFGFDQLLRTLDPEVFLLLLAGGLAYTVGALIYWRDVGRWTDPVWHGFVLVGVSTHFAAIVELLPAGPS
jgi:hemolysin III